MSAGTVEVHAGFMAGFAFMALICDALTGRVLFSSALCEDLELALHEALGHAALHRWVVIRQVMH